MVFDKRQTNIAKGVALLLLLWHHLFYNSQKYYSKFTSLFYFHNIPIECYIAIFCKVCVSIFLLLSGYGIFKTFEIYLKNQNESYIKSSLRFTKNHIIKLLAPYWFIYILFVPIGMLFGRNFLEIYNYNPIYFIADFTGLSYLLFEYNYMFNLTWWFMSIIIVYYLIFPIIYKIMDYSAELILLCSAFCLVLFVIIKGEQDSISVYISNFILGMYFAKRNIFIKILVALNTRMKQILFSFLFIFFMVIVVNFLGGIYFNSIFAVSIIIFSFLCLSKIKVISNILAELGKYSGLIFMFHTFIISYYFEKFTYSSKYSIIIFMVAVIVCYLIARLIKWLMNFIKYNELVLKFTR
jgi:peptidoglycan/LPS O-acetylase OafA/YrhL